MVPSSVAGCRLLATWLHTGYRVTDYLVTGSRFIALPISRNPMRCFVFVSRHHTWEPELSELQMCVFLGHVAGSVCLVTCSWRPAAWYPAAGSAGSKADWPAVWHANWHSVKGVSFDRNTNTQAHAHTHTHEKCRVRACSVSMMSVG